MMLAMNKSAPNTVHRQCRTCLSESNSIRLLQDYVSILDSNMKIAQLIMECASVEINIEDVLPNIICNLCVEYASASFIFRRRCEESEKKLKSQLIKTEVCDSVDSDEPVPIARINDGISKQEVPISNIDPNLFILRDILHTEDVVKNQNNDHPNDGSTPDIDYENPNDNENDFDEIDDDIPLITIKKELDSLPKAKKRIYIKRSRNRKKMFICKDCDNDFHSQYLLMKHRTQYCKNKKDFTRLCCICDLKYESYDLLEEHLVTHTDIECPDCMKKFNTVMKLQKHRLKCNGKLKNVHIKRKRCRVCFMEFNTLPLFKKHCNTHDTFPCIGCGREYVNYRYLRDHQQRKCTQLKDIICAQCGMKFAKLTLLRKHHETHTVIKCPDCGKEFVKMNYLKNHKLYFCQKTGKELPPLYCTICQCSFTHEEDMMKHQDWHSKCTCLYCGKKTSDKNLPRHLRSHEKDGLECPQCDTILNKIDEWRQHVSSHSLFNCKKCLDVFTSIDHLQTHNKRHYFDELQPTHSNECLECNQPFDNRDKLFNHFITHSSYNCPTCKKNMNTIPEIMEHNKQQGCQMEISKRTCDICLEVFHSIASLNLHRRTHIQATSVQCPHCDFSGERSYDVRKHMSREHADLKKIPCPHCEKLFFHLKDLQQHKLIHAETSKHVCDQCGIRFALGTNLKVHMRIHTGERPYKCSVCDKAFVQLATYKKHMFLHQPHEVHVCPTCGKTYPQPHRLQRHMKIHLIVGRPFQCNACSKAFKTKNELRRHMHTHTGAKNFVCSVCDKAFNRNSNLTVHMRIHTGETPYECDVCGKGFIQSNALRSHMKSHGTQWT